jgi:hypothetical protein
MSQSHSKSIVEDVLHKFVERRTPDIHAVNPARNQFEDVTNVQIGKLVIELLCGRTRNAVL